MNTVLSRAPRERVGSAMMAPWADALEGITIRQHTELARLGPLRMALYLESTPEGRVAFFERMRSSSAARSGIVHGDLARKQTARVVQLEFETEAALRRALQRAVIRGSALSKGELERLELGAVDLSGDT